MVTFSKLVETAARWLAYFSAFLILAMSFWITYDVLARNLFGAASPWAFDLSEYSLVWMTFLAAPWILLRDGHVRVEIVVDALGPRAQRFLGLIVSIIGLIVCAVLTWRTGIAAVEYVQGGVMMPRIWHIPRIWPYIAVPFGSAVLTLAFVGRLMLYATNRDPEGALRSRAASGGGESAPTQV